MKTIMTFLCCLVGLVLTGQSALELHLGGRYNVNGFTKLSTLVSGGNSAIFPEFLDQVKPQFSYGLSYYQHINDRCGVLIGIHAIRLQEKFVQDSLVSGTELASGVNDPDLPDRLEIRIRRTTLVVPIAFRYYLADRAATVRPYLQAGLHTHFYTYQRTFMRFDDDPESRDVFSEYQSPELLPSIGAGINGNIGGTWQWFIQADFYSAFKKRFEKPVYEVGFNVGTRMSL